MQPNEMTVNDALAHLETPTSHFLDVRDAGAHSSAHIPGSHHMNDESVQGILDGTPKDEKVIVYCYHGNSSLMAAAWLSEQGFTDVFSMSGGFESWRTTHPDHIASGE